MMNKISWNEGIKNDKLKNVNKKYYKVKNKIRKYHHILPHHNYIVE